MKKTAKRSDKLIMTAEVYAQIKETIGKRIPESGGILGSSDGVHIDHFHFDSTAVISSVSYTMDHKALNEVIHEWNDNDIRLIGIIHSHPQGCIRPSYGDRQTAMHIIDTIDVDGHFFTPIVQVSPELNGDITIYPYTFDADSKLKVQEFEMEQEREDTIMNNSTATAKHRHDRIEGILPESVISKKLVICVGCGGSRSFLESLARCGVRNFVLFDGDVIEDTNIATQGAYISEIGMKKVEVIRSRLLDIEPSAKVICADRYLDNEITDDEFASIAGIDGFNAQDVLICGCTDSFYAQDRCAQLSIKYGVPYLAAQIFKGGIGHEVIFSYPGVTASCPRCMLESRYKKVLDQTDNDTGSSSGTAIAVTEHLNAIKLYTALELLCYNDKETAYYRKLDKQSDRNYLMTRCSWDLAAPAFAPLNELSQHESDLSFPYTTIAIGQTPETGCPLCGGSGDYSKLKMKIKDTRIIPASQ